MSERINLNSEEIFSNESVKELNKKLEDLEKNKGYIDKDKQKKLEKKLETTEEEAKSLNGRRRQIIEKLERLGKEGYVDKDKQEELEIKLKKVETLIKDEGTTVEESETEMVKSKNEEIEKGWKEFENFMKNDEGIKEEMKKEEEKIRKLYEEEGKEGAKKFIDAEINTEFEDEEIFKNIFEDYNIKDNKDNRKRVRDTITRPYYELLDKIESEPETQPEKSEKEKQRERENLEGKKTAQESRDKMWNRVTEIGEKIADNPEMSSEDREKIEDKRSKETVSSVMFEVNLSSYEDPKKKRRRLEDACTAMETSLTEMEIKHEREKIKLTEAKTRAVEKFGIVSEEGMRKAISKRGNQQTGESKEKRGLWNHIKRKFSKNSAEENEGDEKEFDESKFKEAVVAKFLDMQGVTEEKQSQFLKHVGEKKIGVPEEKQEEIASSLLDKYGDGKELEDLIKIIGEFKFTKEDFEEAIERKKIDEIPEIKGFREIVESIENVDDLDGVIKKIEEIAEKSSERKNKDKANTLLNIIADYKKKIISGEEEKFKEVEEGLEKNKENVDNFKAFLLGKDDLKELFERVGELVEKERIEKRLDAIFNENEVKTIEESDSVEKMLESIKKVGINFEAEFTNDESVDNRMLESYLNLLSGIPSNFKRNSKLREDDENRTRDVISKSENDNAKKYFGAVLEKIGEFIDIETGRKENAVDDDRKDSGKDENKGEITEETKGKIKEAFKQLDDLNDEEEKSIKKSFIKASGLKDREVLSLWENNLANDFVQRNKEIFEGVTVGQVMEIMGEDFRDDEDEIVIETEDMNREDVEKEISAFLEKDELNIENVKDFESLKNLLSSLEIEVKNIMKREIPDELKYGLRIVEDKIEMNHFTYCLESKELSADPEDIEENFSKDRNMAKDFEIDSLKDYYLKLLDKVEELYFVEKGRLENKKEKTGEITEEMKGRIREGFEKLKEEMGSLYDEEKLESIYFDDSSLLNSEKLLKEDSRERPPYGNIAVVIENLLGIKFEEIKNIKTKDFMAVLKEVYEEVKGEKKNEKEKIQLEELVRKYEKKSGETYADGGARIGLLEKGINEEKEKLIKNCKNFEELDSVLDRIDKLSLIEPSHGIIKGRKKDYKITEMKNLINRVRIGEIKSNGITRNFGLNEKVVELIAKEKSKK